MDASKGFDAVNTDDNRSVLPSERTTIDFDQPSSLVGHCLDERFLIVKNLTESGADLGGIGVVYLATDTKLMGREVVVKILQESALKFDDIVRKFQHEKEALIRLDHPGIVRILDSGVLSDGNPFMVMDFIKGYSLRKTIRSFGQMPLDLVSHLVESITDAIGAAHSEKILHRDIKPENIMLTPQDEGFDRVRLIDFGIAKVGESKLAPGTEVGRPIGTVMYIAPEQLIGTLDLTPAADIYATAIVIYEMITGELPFKPKTIAQMYQLEREGVKTPPTELRPDLPRGAETILLSALEFEPEMRPQNSRAFGRDLAAELRRDPAIASAQFFASVKTEYSNAATEIVPEIDPRSIVTLRSAAPNTATKKKLRIAIWALPVGLVVILLSIGAAYLAWNAAKSATVIPLQVATPTPSPDFGPERQFSFFLMVRNLLPNKAYGAPTKFTGAGEFKNGDDFTMNFQSETEGYFYIFNEETDSDGRAKYNALYPTIEEKMNAHILAGNPVRTPKAGFDDKPGTEINWVIWTRNELDDMKTVIKYVNTKRSHRVDPPGNSVLTNFLDANRDNAVPETDDTHRLIKLKAHGDIMVHRLPLEHK